MNYLLVVQGFRRTPNSPGLVSLMPTVKTKSLPTIRTANGTSVAIALLIAISSRSDVC